ncbi:MAG: TolC family protein [Sphingobacteriaceae bacterium]|nr:TolC family protein [Cytophagaceae bacterium]
MKPLSFIILLFSSSFVRAQAPVANDPLPGLVRQAIDYYPRLKELQQNVALGETRTKIAESQRRPTLSGDASYSYIWPTPKIDIPIPGVDAGIQFQPHNNYNVGLIASQTVYDWGKINANVERSMAETRQAFDNVDAQKTVLAYQVAQVYYGIVFLEKNLRVQRDQQALVRTTEQVIADRVKSGDEIDYNLVSTRVRYRNVETRIVDLENQIERQYILLGSLIGRDAHALVDSTAVFNAPGLFSAEPVNAYEMAQISNPDLRLSRDREALALRDLDIAGVANRPSLALAGQTGYRNGFQPDINQIRFNGSVGVRLTAPIYSGKRYQLQNELARASLQQARYGMESQQVALKTGLDQVQSELKSASEKLRLSELQVQQARYALQLAEVRLKAGVVTPLEIQTAQTAVEDAEFNRIQFEYQQTLARLELNRLMGTKFW